MKQILLNLKKKFSKHLPVLVMIAVVFSLSSCGPIYKASKKFPAEVHLKGGEILKGYAPLPREKYDLRLYSHNNNKLKLEESYDIKDVDFVRFNRPETPNKIIDIHSVYYDDFIGNSYKWMPQICNNPNVDFFREGQFYILKKNSDIEIGSYGSYLFSGTFSSYIRKKGDSIAVFLEDYNFKEIIPEYLNDDPKIKQKIGKENIKEICNILDKYQPKKQKKIDLRKNVKPIKYREYGFISNFYPRENSLFIRAEETMDDSGYSSLVMGCKRTLFSKFITWETFAGVAQYIKTIDTGKARDFQEKKKQPKSIDEITNENKREFGSNLIMGINGGFQLPIAINKTKILNPSLVYEASATFGVIYIGPKFGLDFYLPVGGSTLIFNGGLKYNNVRFFDNETREYETIILDKTYKTYSDSFLSASIGIGYTF